MATFSVSMVNGELETLDRLARLRAEYQKVGKDDPRELPNRSAVVGDLVRFFGPALEAYYIRLTEEKGALEEKVQPAVPIL